MKKQKLVVYFPGLNDIGGVETFSYIFVKTMCRYYDITFLYGYDKGSTVEKIAKHAHTEKYTGQSISCDIFLSVTSWGICCAKHVEADLKVLMIHGNYSAPHLSSFNPVTINDFDTYVAVSPSSAKGFKDRYGITAKVIYNLIDNLDENNCTE